MKYAVSSEPDEHWYDDTFKIYTPRARKHAALMEFLIAAYQYVIVWLNYEWWLNEQAWSAILQRGKL